MKNEIGNNFPIYLEGKNIYLTPFTRDHLEMKDYWLWLNNLDTTKNLGIHDYVMPVSFEKLTEYFDNNAFKANNILFAVMEKKSNKFIGTVRVSHINWISRTAVIGILLGDLSSRGKRFASEMTRLAVDYIFNVLNLNKITASAHSANIPSLKCFRGLNF